MSEEQLKAAETEASAQVEEGVEEISEDDLEGVAGGVRLEIVDDPQASICTCGEEDCDCLSCDSEATPV